MPKRMLPIAVSLLLLVAAAAVRIAAVTDGELDGNRHPYVGLMVAQAADGTPLWRCSGTLLSPTIFLTAGHCTEAPAAHVEIWFDADVESGIPGNGYPFKGDAAANRTPTRTTTRVRSSASTSASSC
jgi:V8-like Glu-specific endopeptidase